MDFDLEPAVMLWTAVFSVLIWGLIVFSIRSGGWELWQGIVLALATPFISYFIIQRMTR